MRKYARPNQWVSGNVTLLFLYSESYAVVVAPFTGAWIETYYFSYFQLVFARRSRHGSVD